ncbi:hypothetical protein [Vibrio vulnificus]|uniref:hypothetical protein n=1 Tax=Vibrio vulnificus TaxID=672 RepID=UPI001A2E1768|nr:hypothetical protein [Vibrio vulnificus]EKZ9225818.1 hypothetical protein [Vibrio vulnificus]ELC9582659.1 hypothetical protein [Vibrio vulnificus]MCU8149803.1 hypothetical protein [Vibrio vulnificus]MCU8385860.1 hypothetical protein [Vibrio vulnificus]
MKYLLVTSHRIPKFYDLKGNVVEVDLDYVESKTFSLIDENGQLIHQNIGGSPPTVLNNWMVNSIEQSLSILAQNDVYPFISKQAAKMFAKQLGLTAFRYIPLP